MAQKIRPCPKCGGEVLVAPSYGGKGSGDLTEYFARCNACGFMQDHLSKDGSKNWVSAENQTNIQQRNQRNDINLKEVINGKN